MKITLFAGRQTLGFLAGTVFLLGKVMAWGADSTSSGNPDAAKPSIPAAKASLVFLGDSHTANRIYANTAFDFLSKAGCATEKFRCYGFA